MSAALQLDRLITSWESEHGPVVYRGRAAKIVEVVDLQFQDGSGARLTRDQGKEFWTIARAPSDRSASPEFTPPDTMARRGCDPEWRRPYQAQR